MQKGLELTLAATSIAASAPAGLVASGGGAILAGAAVVLIRALQVVSAPCMAHQQVKNNRALCKRRAWYYSLV